MVITHVIPYNTVYVKMAYAIVPILPLVQIAMSVAASPVLVKP